MFTDKLEVYFLTKSPYSDKESFTPGIQLNGCEFSTALFVIEDLDLFVSPF